MKNFFKRFREFLFGAYSHTSHFQINNVKVVLKTMNNRSKIVVNGVTVYDGPALKGGIELKSGVLKVGSTTISLDGVAQAPVFNVSITGDVSGGVENESGDIRITGDVGGSVRTVSGYLHIDGNVNSGVSSVSGDVEISGSVNGSVSTISGDVRK
jgi:hypothetical protein